MQSGTILPIDVRVNEKDKLISIFGVDPVGYNYSSEGYLVDGIDLYDLDGLVAWAFNLGYEAGLKTG